MENTFCKNLRHIQFMIFTVWILFTEYINYLLYKNYDETIDNLTNRLAAINILYVKIFQAIALNNQFIDEQTNAKLLKFTDNAPWAHDDIDENLLMNICEDANISIDNNDYYTPINTGMISMVYKGKYNDTNIPVIIKIKRHNIENKLRIALDDIVYTIDFFSYLPILKKYNIPQIIRDCAETLYNQVNFEEEVKNTITIRGNCKNIKYVKIPEINASVTIKYPNAIVMEYINGVPIHMVSPEDYDVFAKLVMKFGFTTTLLHGFTHADLHAGNILFIKDDSDKVPYKIGVIDFGVVFNINPTYKNNLLEIFSELFSLNPYEISKKILVSGILEPINVINSLPEHNFMDIINFTSIIIEKTIQEKKEANQKQIYKFTYELYQYLKNNHELSRLGIYPSESFINSQMSIAMAHGVTMRLCENNYMELADKVLNEMFHIHLLTDDD